MNLLLDSPTLLCLMVAKPNLNGTAAALVYAHGTDLMVENCMIIDLREDVRDIYWYIVRRVATYDPFTDQGPGEPNAPISRISMGYQCDQAGWVVLVFDKRVNAESDGQWNSFIEPNAFERPHWQAAWEIAMETGPVQYILPDGSNHVISATTSDEVYAKIFGEMLKHILLKARDDGIFVELPTSKKCYLDIDEHDGNYGWPGYDDRGKNNLV